MKKQMLTILTSILVGIIAGCGGSGSSTPATSISGKVADGYLAGATVFLDKNGNYQLDAGEPFATSDQNGVYTLNVDPVDVGKYPIVAMATKGVTKDLDTNTFVNNSYVLSMPATAISGTVSSNFISPMSSELREMMETGNYATMQDAMNALRTKLGMPVGTDMLADYMAANNTTMHAVAQNMASLMGGQMGPVMGAGGTSVDVNRYRAMMGTIFSNMSIINGINVQTAMATIGSKMTSDLEAMPMMTAGQPFRNMSAAFRGSTMGGMM